MSDTPEKGGPEAPAGADDKPPKKRARRVAPPLAEPVDVALAGAIDAYRRGDYRSAAARAPGSVPDVGDDRAHLSRLERALAWEPTLWLTAAICGAVWLWAFLAAQPS